MRRGACPSLSSPMQTGDGLLARLNPKDERLSARQLAGVADAAGRFGNGILEITARGSLQIRGLSQESASGLADAINELGIEAANGPEIRVGPLAGCDRLEIADPRPVADAVRRHIAAAGPLRGLAPKISVVVDGGGALPLDGIAADIRIAAVAGDLWAVGIGGTASAARLLGAGDGERAAAAAFAILRELAARGETARGRDLDGETAARLTQGLDPCPGHAPSPAAVPVGRFALGDGSVARGIAPAFGQIAADALAALAEAAGAARTLALSPGRALIVLGLSQREDDALMPVAGGLGLVTAPDDPRLRIVACAGSPACASAHLPTKAIAHALAAARPDLVAAAGDVHLSGCAKHCAKPAQSGITLTGGPDGFDIAPAAGELPALLARLAEQYGATSWRRRA